MAYTPQTWVNGSSKLNATRMSYIETGITDAATTADGAVAADSVTVAATRVLANKLLVGDTQPAFRAKGDGKLEWGAGGSTAVDTNLYRSLAGYLRTDGVFQSAKWVEVGDGQGSGNYAVVARVSADAGFRFFLKNQGLLEWGDGSAFSGDTNLYRSSANYLATDDDFAANASGSDRILLRSNSKPEIVFGSLADTNLYRSAANVLKTDDNLQVALSLYLDTGGTGGYLFFGASADTNLYRNAANTLRTDDLFYAVGGIELFAKAGIPVDGDFAALGNIICLDTTNSRIYVRVSGTWKYAALT